MAERTVGKRDIERAAQSLAREMSTTDTVAVRVHHGSWSAYHIATVLVLVWPDGHEESMSLRGTKKEVLRQLQTARNAVMLVNENTGLW